MMTLATILIVDHGAMTWQVLETHQKYRTPGGIARRLGPCWKLSDRESSVREYETLY